MKVGRDRGSNTVEDILNVLNDEIFDLQAFLRKLKCFKDFDNIVTSFMGNSKENPLYLVHLLLKFLCYVLSYQI